MHTSRIGWVTRCYTDYTQQSKGQISQVQGQVSQVKGHDIVLTDKLDGAGLQEEFNQLRCDLGQYSLVLTEKVHT